VQNIPKSMKLSENEHILNQFSGKSQQVSNSSENF